MISSIRKIIFLIVKASNSKELEAFTHLCYADFNTSSDRLVGDGPAFAVQYFKR
jgi:hypothetical protein